MIDRHPIMALCCTTCNNPLCWLAQMCKVIHKIFIKYCRWSSEGSSCNSCCIGRVNMSYVIFSTCIDFTLSYDVLLPSLLSSKVCQLICTDGACWLLCNMWTVPLLQLYTKSQFHTVAVQWPLFTNYTHLQARLPVIGTRAPCWRLVEYGTL